MHHILWALSKARNLADKRRLEVFLVGGFVRDLFLNEYSKDIDLLVTGHCLEFSQQLAKETGGTLIALGGKHQLYRVVIKKTGIRMDITSFAEGQFIKNLLNRDFTCNAIALNVKHYLENNIWWDKVLDPSKGLEDLSRRKLRPLKKDAFSNDPVRILRGLRLAAQFGLDLEPEYHVQAQAAAPLLYNVPGERIKQELWPLLKQQYSHRYVKLLDNWQVLDVIFPAIGQLRRTEQNYHHAENAWAHSLRVLKVLELDGIDYLPRKVKVLIPDYLSQKLSVDGNRGQVLKLAALIHDIGKIDTSNTLPDGRITFHGHDKAGLKYAEKISERLRLGKHEQQSLSNIVGLHMRPLALAVEKKVSEQAYYRFLKKAKDDVGMILLLSFADVSATRAAKGKTIEPSYVKYLSQLWEMSLHYNYKDSLLNGDDLINNLDVKPGPIVGVLLDRVKQARFSGRIKNKEEALRFAEDELNKKRKDDE